MAGKIKKSDLFEDNIFPNKEAEEYKTSIDAIVLATGNLVKVNMEAAQTNPLRSAKDIKEINKSIDEGTKSITLNVKARQQQEKLTQEEIKTSILREKKYRELNKTIDDSNKKYEKLNKESAKATAEMQKQLGTLSRIKEENKKLTKERDLLNLSEQKGRDRLIEINAQLDKNNEFIKENTDALGKQKINIGNYIGDLRKMQKELAALEPGTKQFNDLAQKTGELKDKINDAAEATKAFASSSKLTQGKTLFGQIFGDITDLNFQGAADKAKQFASIIGSISFKEVIGGIKNFGSALLDLGKAAFLNPLTGIVAGVLAVGIALKDVYDSWQKTIHFSDEFAASISDLRKKTDELTKSTRDLRLENSNLSDDEKNRVKAANKFKDEYIDIKSKELSEIKRINEKFNQESKIGTGEAFLAGVGGNLSNQLRIKELLKARSGAIINIQKETSATLAALQENYTEELKGVYKNDTKNFNESEKEKTRILKKEVQERLDAYYDEYLRQQVELEKDVTKKALLEEDLRFISQVNRLKNTIENQKELNELLEREEEIHQKRISEIINKSQQDIRIAKGVLDESDVGTNPRIQREKDEINEIIKLEKQLTDAIKIELDRRQNQNIEAIDADISRREKAIEEQQSLAERGLENTLAFEKEALAKSELAKKQELERQRRQDEAIKLSELFLNSLNGKLADGKTSYLKASSEALAETFAAKGLSSLIAGSFIEGTEKVEDDLSGNKIHNGKDGYVIAVDGKERIFNPLHNSLLGDMSNEEVVRRALINPEVPGVGQKMADSIMLHQMVGVKNEISELKNIVKNRPHQHFAVDSFGNIIETIYKNDEKIITKFMNKNRRSDL